MTLTTPSVEPSVIRAGDSVAWDRTLPEFSASSGWTVSYRIVGVAQKYDIATSGAGDVWSVALTSATTSAYTAGRYTLVGYAAKGTERHTFYASRCEVMPNLAEIGQFDGRSAARVALDAARAALYSMTGDRAVSYTIGDRTVSFEARADLIAHVQYLEREVAREAAAAQVAAGMGMPPGRVMVRM